MPPGTGDAYLTIFNEMTIDNFILVTTPSNLALADTKKTINLIEKFKISILGYIENNISGLKDNINDELFVNKNISNIGVFQFSEQMANFNIKNQIVDADKIIKKLINDEC